MSSETTSIDDTRSYDLRRFVQAQEGIYREVLAELQRGQKRTHWMWFIFPQIAGLGYSATSKRYAIQNREEAEHYLRHPTLGKRLVECAETVLHTTGRSASQIFGSPDDMKLKSCMTLFASLPDAPLVFLQVLEKYFQGQQDTKTLQLLRQASADGA